MNKTLEKILEDEIFENETIEGEDNIQIQNTSEGTKLGIEVLGNSKQEIREGYNLLNITAKSINYNGVMFTNNQDGTATLNGTLREGENLGGLSLLINNKSWSADDFPWGEEVTFKVEGLVEGVNLIIAEADETGAWTKNIAECTSQKNKVITTPVRGETTQFIRCNFSGQAGIELNNITIKPMLYIGTEDKAFQQYGVSPSLEYPSKRQSVGDDGSIDAIVENKNILSTTICESYKDSEITITHDGNDLWNFEGNATSKDVWFEFIKRGKLKLKSNHIYSLISNQDTIINKFHLMIQIFKKDGQSDVYPLNSTIKIDENYEDARLTFFSKQGTILNYKNVWFMLCEGKELAQNWIKHQEQNVSVPVQKPFREIDNYRDIFINKNGKMYEQHLINRYEFTGEENFGNSVDPNRYDLYVPQNNQIKTPDYDKKGSIRSNMFKHALDFNIDSFFGNICMNRNYIIFPDKNNEYTLETFKAKLKELYNKGTPAYIDYVLAEPELIECNEEQIKALGKLAQATAYDDITNIICTNEVPCNFKVNAKISKIKKIVGGK